MDDVRHGLRIDDSGGLSLCPRRLKGLRRPTRKIPGLGTAELVREERCHSWQIQKQLVPSRLTIVDQVILNDESDSDSLLYWETLWKFEPVARVRLATELCEKFGSFAPGIEDESKGTGVFFERASKRLPSPLISLNEFLLIGHETWDQDHLHPEWKPFTLSPDEYREVKAWWVASHPGSVESDLGAKGWDHWLGLILHPADWDFPNGLPRPNTTAQLNEPPDPAEQDAPPDRGGE